MFLKSYDTVSTVGVVVVAGGTLFIFVCWDHVWCSKLDSNMAIKEVILKGNLN
jgi:hypothetical protein